MNRSLDPATPAHAFADRAWDEFLALDPLWATAQGDERFDDTLDDPGPDGRAALLAMADRWEAEIAGLDAPQLGVEQVEVGAHRDPPMVDVALATPTSTRLSWSLAATKSVASII